MLVRPGTPEDLEGVLRILRQSPEASQWAPEEHAFLVAERGAAIAGVLVWRHTAPDEIEILNIAVDPAFRRRGVARALLRKLPASTVYLEVRESNQGARELYTSTGFQEVGKRPGYYREPSEAAIVMRFQS